MRKRLSKAAKMTVGISILAVLPYVSPCAAQTAITPSKDGIPTEIPKLVPLLRAHQRQHVIRLRHVKASWIAHWFDSKNHPKPLDMPIPNGLLLNPASALPLPKGIERIVALDPQNALLVVGTDEGIRELKETIAFLDKPLREIQIEAQIVEISSLRLGGIWASLASQFQLQNSAMGLSSQADQTLLRENFARKEATLLSLQIQKFISNATQTLDFSAATPANFTSPSLTIPGRPPGDFKSPMPIFPLPQDMAPMPGRMFGQITPRKTATLKPFDTIRLRITSTLNADGGATLFIEGAGLAPHDLQSIAHVPAGQSLVFALPVFNFQFSKRAFLILTPHAVRRAETP
jgi:hypothetical protein